MGGRSRALVQKQTRPRKETGKKSRQSACQRNRHGQKKLGGKRKKREPRESKKKASEGPYLLKKENEEITLREKRLTFAAGEKKEGSFIIGRRPFRGKGRTAHDASPTN